MAVTPGCPRSLLVVCALGIEWLALRHATDVGTTLVRTGMGAAAARHAVGGALRAEPARGHTAVLATGFCAGLDPGMRPGDLVLAEHIRDDAGERTCVGVPGLVAACASHAARRARGHAVHTGRLTETSRLVRGAERKALRASGAIATDMESAATVRTALADAPARPVAAVRVVVDAPGHELVRLRTLRGGALAFRILRSLMPVFHEWHQTLLLSGR
ncbi:1-hydroxy-2-methyl-2-butenyl 4-diphosphate reductase [Streptomyces oceani]|uniref:1-hydroxy-2-methyl-2-butenyl 4-diphosphate reductase n=1 Tax=Streptomyces oceani TaxID=1075402 RepID=A0A1E7KJ73_9ACTN|nr:1-hydroxy-2-methyl-2-butenyl 4-diphosphate reductase [Streptomyces oceani]OEV03946.1 1-hydroxy-2-methyl-2-butenyl 4-diphosphate reductase [Streptomyces oceani]